MDRIASRPITSRLDRGVRFVLGVVLLGLYGALDSPLRYVALLGLPLIATAVTGFCPLYAVLGRNAPERRKIRE